VQRRQRDAERLQRDAERLQRLADFNALLAKVNQTLTTPLSQDELLQAICRLAAQYTHLQLAVVAQPNAAGIFEWRASAGDTRYLKDLIISLDPDRPEGRGPMGQAWRSGQPIFVQDITQSTSHQPWLDQLKQAQFKAAAALPITLMGQPFGVLSIYHAQINAFDPELQKLLTELAETTSRGLEIVQARLNEAKLAAQLSAERESAEYRALHDALTGLPNRTALMQHLSSALARARRQGSALAVGMLDLDDFKLINDKFGHAAGDELLRQVTQRLRERLRETDFLARLGGDEFVLIFEDLLDEQVQAQLTLMLQRLRGVIETPFILEGAQEAVIGLSLGLALYPRAGIDADQLLRQADAAMYAIKARKHQRATWWQLSDEDTAQTPAVLEAFTAFDAQAVTVLTRIQPLLAQVADVFVAKFYEGMALEPEMAAILAALGDKEMVHLKQQQKAHLLFLLQPQTTELKIQTRARRLGYVHALIGVTARLLLKSMTLYRQQLNLFIGQALFTGRERYHLTQVLDARLDLDMQEQIARQDGLFYTYLEVLNAPIDGSDGLFADALKQELQRFGQLPGIVLALLLRLNADGVFVVEQAGGPQAEAAMALMLQPGFEISIDPQSPNGQGLVAQCWRAQTVLSSPSYAKDPRYAIWRPVAETVGIRSHLAIPIINAAGHSAWVLSLYGAYPHQFEIPVMRHFAHGIQHRFQQFLRQRHASSYSPVPIDQAHAWIARLFDGGLQLYAQPILDFKQGRVFKVELLARLQLPDGTVIAPGLFLPLLGDAELDRLFRHGLKKALRKIATWDQMGYAIDAAINLSPSALLDPDCVTWVRDALAQSSIAPERLTLELLETQEIVEQSAASATLLELRALGLKLAMDDVGSGFSGLLRIAQMPFDVLKIDQGLVMRLRTDPVSTLSLIRAIIQIGCDFNRVIVVEGLEDAGVIEAVRVLGADFGQGYGIARPMPASELPGWLDAFHAADPVPTQTIQTLLGALAQHLRFSHQEESWVHAADCPVHAFLTAWTGNGGEQAVIFHQRLHEASSVQERQQAHHQLVQWLVERILAESAAAP
jgi:diguanylate cyclase (GGDEF)-like protein